MTLEELKDQRKLSKINYICVSVTDEKFLRGKLLWKLQTKLNNLELYRKIANITLIGKTDWLK